MDLPTLRKVQARWAPCVATGLGNARHLAKAGIRSTVELDWWQSTELAGAQGNLRARTAFFFARTARPEPLSLGRVRHRGPRSGRLFRRRFRLLPTLRRDRPQVPSHRSRAHSDWRLRATMVHAPASRGPGGSGASASRPEAASQPRHAFRHIPVDRRSHRRASVGASTSAGSGRRCRTGFRCPRVRGNPRIPEGMMAWSYELRLDPGVRHRPTSWPPSRTRAP